MKNDREQGAPAPAAIGLVWRVAGVLAVPVLGAALMLWRSDALQNQELATLHAENITLRAALDEHLRSDAAAKTAATEREREFAVALGRIQAALDAAGRSVDALFAALSRRRPG